MRFQVWFQVWWYKYERKSKNKINHHESPRKTRWFGQSQRVSVGWWEKRLPGRLGLLFRILDSSDKESRQEKKKWRQGLSPQTSYLRLGYSKYHINKRKMIKFYVQGVDVTSLYWRLLLHTINYLCVSVLNAKQLFLLNMRSNNRNYSSVFPEKYLFSISAFKQLF